METGSAQQSLLLPQVIIEEEILSRLAVKSLLRFRCVSKSWRSLIDSKRFIKTHLQNSTKNTRLLHRKVLYIDDLKAFFDKQAVSECSLLSFLDRSYECASELNFLTDLPLSLPPSLFSPSFVGCCNGLVCILLKGLRTQHFILWNPSTRITKKLPALGEDSVGYGFGFDESRDDYKVVAIVSRRRKAPTTCRVYSVKADSWKVTINGSDHRIPSAWYNRAAVLASGKLHWERNCCYKPSELEILLFDWKRCNCCRKPAEWEIVCFDLKREVFEMVEQPCYDEGGLELTLGKLGDFLAVMVKYESWDDIWVMKEYGAKESWLKVVVVDRCYLPLWASPSMDSLFSSGEEGDNILLLRVDSRYRVFNVKKSHFQNLNLSRESAIYIGSLVSPLG